MFSAKKKKKNAYPGNPPDPVREGKVVQRAKIIYQCVLIKIVSSENGPDRINEERFSTTLRVSLINPDTLLSANMTA